MSKRVARRRAKKDNTLPRTRKDFNQDKRIMRVEKKIKSLETQEELKYLDILFTSTVTTTANVDLLNGIAVGTSQVARIGGMIHMTSIQWKFTLNSMTNILTPTTFRYMIVLDRQANGAAPTFNGSPLAGTVAILNTNIITSPTVAPIQFENKKRFRIIKDKTISLNPQMSLQDANPATAVVAVERTITGYKKLGVNTKYGDDVATVAGINTNALYFIAITDLANAASITGGSRIYFRDA